MKYLGGIFMIMVFKKKKVIAAACLLALCAGLTGACCSTNCVNNKHGTCKAHEINVNGQGAHFSSDTECNGFNNSKLRSTLNMFDNMNIVSRLQDYTANPPITSVNCTANNCFYNKDGHCIAEHLSFNNDNLRDKTNCNTFIEAY